MIVCRYVAMFLHIMCLFCDVIVEKVMVKKSFHSMKYEQRNSRFSVM